MSACIPVQGDFSATSAQMRNAYDQNFSTLVTTEANVLRNSTNQLISLTEQYLSASTINWPSVISRLQTDGLLLTQNDFNLLVQITSQPPQAPPTRQADIEQKNKKLLNHIVIEYRFYFCRFNALLNTYATVFSSRINNLPNGSLNGVTNATVPQNLFRNATGQLSRQQATLQAIQEQIIILNKKLQNLARLVTEIGNSSLQLIQTFRTNDTTNADLTRAIESLNSSAVTTQIQDLETKRRAIEYTKEKNRYSNLYLGLYAFLNISALAIILHIATS